MEKVGLFDDVFGYGGEEWDFCYRCHGREVRLLRDSGLWVIHLRSPETRSKNAEALIIKNMVIAQARYMPFCTLLVFLLVQSAKSFLDSVRHRNLAQFLFAWSGVIFDWHAQVWRKRKPVSREVMSRFFYLRTHSTSDFSYIDDAAMTIGQFYMHRVRHGTIENPRGHAYIRLYG